MLVLILLSYTLANSKSEHKVPLTHVRQCHLLNYKSYIIPIVLAHCQYSLRLGEGQNVTYDLPALEQHLLNRFIYGKPLILSDIPQVQYRKDVYTSGNFAVIRRTVSPQVTLYFDEQARALLSDTSMQTQLPFEVQLDILSDLHSSNSLRECLDVVDIVLGFLSSGGGKADKNLGDYIDNTLRMSKREFSAKVSATMLVFNLCGKVLFVFRLSNFAHLEIFYLFGRFWQLHWLRG